MSASLFLSTWLELTRPFSWTASAIPVLVGAALAWSRGQFSWPLFLLTLLGSILLQAGTNVINELYDVRRGVDTLETPRASKVLVQGRMGEREAYIGALVIFAVAAVIGCYLGTQRGAAVFWLTLLGVLGGYCYTAKPLAYKYRALGTPLVFFLMGPFMVWGAYIVQMRTIDVTGALLSVPVGCLVSAILHANDLRDFADDAKTGVRTFAMLTGRRGGAYFYDGLLAAAYLTVIGMVLARAISPWALITLATLPLAAQAVKRVEASLAAGSPGPLATLDIHTAKLHMAFGVLLTVGLILSGVSTI